MTYPIRTFNNIREKGLALFGNEHYAVGADSNDPICILLRSHKLQLEEIPESVIAIGRAGAGVNNIPVAALTQRGIPVFNTPGANANAVKELVLGGMMMACRHLKPATQYLETLEENDNTFDELVEKGKKQFAGKELPNRTLGVIGLGAIGVKVANSAHALGLNVIGFDPAMSMKNALALSEHVRHTESLEELLRQADFISLHIPLNDETKDFISAQKIQLLPKGAVILNFARQGIVNECAVKSALQNEHLSAYVTDFPSPKLQGLPNVIAFPHLGASTTEAEENCSVMIATQIKNYLEHGTITHAVNFPSVQLPRAPKAHRLAIVNANQPNMVAQISSCLGQHNFNIIELLNKSKNEIAYTLIDVDQPITEPLLKELSSIDGVIKTRKVPA